MKKYTKLALFTLFSACSLLGMNQPEPVKRGPQEDLEQLIEIQRAEDDVRIAEIPLGDIKASPVLSDLRDEFEDKNRIIVTYGQTEPLQAIRDYLAKERTIGTHEIMQEVLEQEFTQKSESELAKILNAAQIFQTNHISNAACKVLAAKLNTHERREAMFKSEDGSYGLELTPDTANMVAQNMRPRKVFWLLQEQIKKHGSVLFNSLQGHTKSVHSVSWSPDSRMLASGCRDKTIRIWDAATGKQVGDPLQGHIADINSVSWNPNEKILASGSLDNTIRIWDVTTGKQVDNPLPLGGHAGLAWSVGWNPDGRKLAASLVDGTICIWDVVTNKQMGKVDNFLRGGHASRVVSVSWNPDGTMLASGSWDKTVRIWDIATGKQVGNPLEGHTESVNSVGWNPDGKMLASGAMDKTIRIWDVTTGNLVGDPLHGHTDSVNSVSWSSDGRMLASGSWDDSIRVWSLADKKSVLIPYLKNNLTPEQVAFLEYAAECKLNNRACAVSKYPGIAKINEKLPEDLQSIVLPK